MDRTQTSRTLSSQHPQQVIEKFDDFIKQLCAYRYKRRNVFDQSDRAQIVMGVPKREGPLWINQKSVKRCH